MCGELDMIRNACRPDPNCSQLVNILNSSCGSTGGNTGGSTGGNTGGSTNDITWPCSCGELQMTTNTCPSMCEPRRCQTNIAIPNGAIVQAVGTGRDLRYYYNGQLIECVDSFSLNGGYPSPIS